MNPDPQFKSVSDAALDREIETILGVDPSPGFVPRVRARIADAPAPTAWRFGWTALAAVAMTAAIVLTLSLTRPHETIETLVPEPLPADSLLADVVPTPTPAAMHVSKFIKRGNKEPEMLFSPDETAAFQRLLNEGPSQWVEVTVVLIKPQPIPEVRTIPIPIFEPTNIQLFTLAAAPKGDIQ